MMYAGLRAPDHPLRFGADREQASVLGVDGNDGWLVEDDATAAHVDDGVGRAEVNGHVTAHERREDSVGHAGSLRGATSGRECERL
jgi:hypothetical protein